MRISNASRRVLQAGLAVGVALGIGGGGAAEAHFSSCDDDVALKEEVVSHTTVGVQPTDQGQLVLVCMNQGLTPWNGGTVNWGIGVEQHPLGSVGVAQCNILPGTGCTTVVGRTGVEASPTTPSATTGSSPSGSACIGSTCPWAKMTTNGSPGSAWVAGTQTTIPGACLAQPAGNGATCP